MKVVYKTVKKIDSIATGNNARIERLTFRISQSDVALHMGMSRQILCDHENGRRVWTKEKVEKFNKAIKELKG